MDLIEQIGPVLGIAAFVGLAVLAFLLFQQSRDVRRLREWAGRAPERAREAAEASLAAAEARTPAEPAEPRAGIRGRIGAAWSGLRGRVAGAWRRIDRRLPIDARYVIAALAAIVIVAGVLTSGFGLVEEEGGTDGGQRDSKPEKPPVAVLNGTQTEGAGAIPGLAALISDQVVKPLHYKVTTEDNAPQGLANTTVMFAPGFEDAANVLARRVRPKLGDSPVVPMSDDARRASKGAKVALVVGLDDSTFQ